MDEDVIKAIEDRGYDPAVIIALSHGVSSGLLSKAKDSWYGRTFTTRREKNKSKKEPREEGKSRVTQASKVSCVCADCGEITRSAICPNCGHDNYEIMAIKGVKNEG